MDIYYAYNERCPWNFKEKVAVNAGYHLDDNDDFIDAIVELNGITEHQLTLVDLNSPLKKTVSAWRGELRVFSQVLIDDLLASEGLEIVRFDSPNPDIDEELRDIIGSLMLDGMTKHQAEAELIRAGEMKSSEMSLPGYFYRPIGWYYNQFCEEPEYEQWKSDRVEVPDPRLEGHSVLQGVRLA